MTITKQECLKLLFELKNKGVYCDKEIKKLLTMTSPDIEIIKFINDKMELNLRKFYEKLRKSYNNKKSKLYINIVKNTELPPEEVICCLGALLQQILLFNKTLEKTNFLKEARADEILYCIKQYIESNDIISSQKLLTLVKADLKTLEIISKE